jgi:tRNA uridine 5-carbamoylmethylation protein Kti12
VTPNFCSIKINSKWIIINLNVRPESLIHKEMFQDKGIVNDFLNRIPIAQEIIERTGKWDCITLMLLHRKVNNGLRRQQTR